VSNGTQLFWLQILALPIACVSWTITHEEVLREPRERCVEKSRNCPRWYQRKFFYVFTCEYCLSHYVAAVFLAITRYKLLLQDWRGYLLSLFALVWVANFYMSIFARLRLEVKHERLEVQMEQQQPRRKAA
jgi:hypothetical protein